MSEADGTAAHVDIKEATSWIQDYRVSNRSMFWHSTIRSGWREVALQGEAVNLLA